MIKALIAVRSGSERVVNKNMRPFAGSTLLEIKINQLKRIKELDGIIVNSNDDGMLLLAKSLGAETVKRDEYFSSSSVSMSDVYKNMAENFNGDIVVYSNVTNPILQDATLSQAIRIYKELEGEFDSLNSTNILKEFMYKDGQALNYDPKNQPRSQDLPDIHALNFALSILKKDDMIKNKNVVGLKPYLYAISDYEATDIDNMIDFEFAEFLYNRGLK